MFAPPPDLKKRSREGGSTTGATGGPGLPPPPPSNPHTTGPTGPSFRVGEQVGPKRKVGHFGPSRRPPTPPAPPQVDRRREQQIDKRHERERELGLATREKKMEERKRRREMPPPARESGQGGMIREMLRKRLEPPDRRM